MKPHHRHSSANGCTRFRAAFAALGAWVALAAFDPTTAAAQLPPAGTPASPPPALRSAAPRAWGLASRPGAQPTPAASPSRRIGAVLAVPPPGIRDSNPDDPAHPAYRKAYELILRERWKEARDAFTALVKDHPRSEYVDDAEYWIAYSWRESDQVRAMGAYKDFVAKHKESPYYDDALADMDQLLARSLVLAAPAPSVTSVVRPGTPPVLAIPADSSLLSTTTVLPVPAIAPMMRYSRIGGMLRGVPGLAWPFRSWNDEELDDRTKLRLEAVDALGRSGEDAKSFGTLRAIALDRKEARAVRVSAIETLSGFRKHDALPVVAEIARTDTSEEMRLFAIDCIGRAARDREKALDALLDLYRSYGPGDDGKRRMVFYAIASVGTDRAVDFLAGVARSRDSYELRRDAIHYLGSIGGEKARAVLLEVLEGDSRR